MYDIKVRLAERSLGPSVYGDLFTYQPSDITVYVDVACWSAPHHHSKYKIALLIEPITVAGGTYKWVYQNHSYFDLIMTHNKDMAANADKFVYYPIWPKIWIPKEDRKMYDKSKMASAIFSAAAVTQGHRFRHEIVKELKDLNLMDVYGREYNPVETKTEGLADYRYHVVVENEENGYASEKVNDAFCCGSIPIYWGNEDSNIHDYYNTEGVLFFQTIDELKDILTNVVSEEHYNSKLSVVEENYNLAKDLTLDHIYWNYGIKQFAEQKGLIDK